MNAKLRIISGGENIDCQELKNRFTYIGRGDKNQIQIKHSSISRKHCVIERSEDDFFITDLKSLNGTLVKEKNVQETKLLHGDRIQIGDFNVVFEFGEQSANQITDTVSIDEAEIRLPPNSVVFPLDENISTISRNLDGLLNITKQINVIHELDLLQEEILKQVFEIVPANEGALILVGDNYEFEEVVGLNRKGSSETVCISRTIVSRVMKEKSAILASDVVHDNRKLRSESLAIAGTLSLLCVPLVLYGKILGAIYLTTDNSEECFDKTHLHFLIAISSIASVAIENARNFSFLQSENIRLKTENLLKRDMIGESRALQKVFDFIAKIAPTDSTVLVGGESGTGKELASRAIHINSLRAEKPFVVINCATITDTLLESELFGYEKGAFTGAVKQKKGRIELANGGTLLLDEIGELAPSLQVKLLRVLQEREFERVGGMKSIKVDIRLIAATNRDLEEEVAIGRFREDLFYRLNVIHLILPPLRDREGDILSLAEEFRKKYSSRIKRTTRGISTKAKKVLSGYNFPGNIRELENAMESAVILGTNEWVQPEDLPEKFVKAKKSAGDIEDGTMLSLQNGIREAKKHLIQQAFQEAKGNYVKTAKLLDVHPNYLHRLIRVLDIKANLQTDLSLK